LSLGFSDSNQNNEEEFLLESSQETIRPGLTLL